MRTRIRIGPFTFGRSGTRLSIWSKGSGFSIPLFNRKNQSFGKIKVGIFSFFFRSKNKNNSSKFRKAKRIHNKAYEPWTSNDDKMLIKLFREGKTTNELQEYFGRSKGSIISRINKLLLK
ncbi:MAG: hypothetical protein KDD32_12050 [Bacteroidetes bacterium]|nr:hypothetical protein [Bacteroidota bacterium]